MAKDQREELVCSMVMRSENATLKNLNNNKDDSLLRLQAARVLRYCSLLLFVICSINTISVSVAVLQIENNFFLFSHNKINPHTYLLLQQEL